MSLFDDGIKNINTTYYIEDKLLEGEERGSLAINIRINAEQKLMSWNDTSQHPKSLRYNDLKINDGDREIVVEKKNGEQIKFKLLTVDLFNKFIHGDVPQEALESNERLRAYYSWLAENPNG